MKRVFLTGIGGSIATHVFAHFMHNTDWQVVGIDSFRHKGWADRLAVYLNDHPQWRERLTVVTHDLAAPFSEMTKKTIGHVDVIISMASLSDVEESIQDPVPFIQNNVNLCLNVLEFAREIKPEVFVQISTDEVYGAVATKDDSKCKEWAPILPSNPYAASKAAQEAIAISYWRTYEVPVIITNTMNLFGETQDPEKYTAQLIKKIYDGELVTVHGSVGNIGSRFYLHARNGADAVLHIVKNLKPKLYNNGENPLPDRYNIVGDVEMDNLELAKLVAEILGKELKYELVDFHSARAGHDRRYALDGEKLKATGWKAPMEFKSSLIKSIEWTLNNPRWI